MRLEVVDEIEEFIREGSLWDPDHLQKVIDRLADEHETQGDDFAGQLARFLSSIHMRMAIGVVPPRMAVDVEGIVYPRLWKVMEAVRDGLPPGELRTRIEVMKRRLSRLFAEEQ